MRVSRVTEADWSTVVGFVVGSTIYILLIVEGLFRHGALTAIPDATNGLINTTFVSSLLATLVLIGGIILWYGTLSPSDLGLSPEKVSIGVGLTVGIWLAIQGTTLFVGMVLGGTRLHPIWTEMGFLAGIGQVIGHLFGNAVYEELGFRAFLFPQLYLKLRGDWWDGHPVRRAVIALVASQGVFTLLHAPILLFNGATGLALVQSLAAIFGFAVFLTVVYVRTRNIYFTIGLHALLNFSAPVVEVPGFDSSVVLFVGTVVVLVAWQRLRFGRSGSILDT